MNLEHTPDKEILRGACHFRSLEKNAVVKLLYYLCQIESRKLFADLNYDSMFMYLVKEMKYSEGEAGIRLAAARLLMKKPEIAQKIDNGSLSLTNLSMLGRAFRNDAISPERQDVLIKKVENVSSRQCEQNILEETGGQLPQRTVIKRQSSNHHRLHLDLSDDVIADLQKLKKLMIHKGNFTYEELIALMTREALEKHDPQLKDVRKSKQHKQKKLKHERESFCANEAMHKTQTRYIPEKIRRIVRERAAHRCEWRHPETGVACSSQFGLEFHHKNPFCRSKNHDPANLELLCLAHHQRESIKTFGKKKMKR
jgi:hypothetical protein